jgi:hypothetical protein
MYGDWAVLRVLGRVYGLHGNSAVTTGALQYHRSDYRALQSLRELIIHFRTPLLTMVALVVTTGAPVVTIGAA